MLNQVYVGVFVLLIFYLQKGESVKCYSCTSKYNPDCLKPDKSQISLVKCDMNYMDETRRYARDIDPSYDKLFEVDMIDTGGIGLTCLKVVTKVGNKDYVLRGCQLADQGDLDICKKIEETNSVMLRTVYCSKCTGEGCNSSTKSNIDMLLTFMCIVIAVIFYGYSQ